jgi:hypothetical protein
MTVDLNSPAHDDLDRRLRDACHAVIPFLLDDAPAAAAGPQTLELSLRDERHDVAIGAPSRKSPRVLTAVAAAVLVIVGATATWSARRNTDTDHRVSSPVAAPPSTDASRTTSSSGPPSTQMVCPDAGCSDFEPLPVVPGATDFYTGGTDLGSPEIARELFGTLTRCTELTSDFSACQRVEGIAGVNLVSYPVGTLRESDGSSTTSMDIRIGTTFTDLSPTEYAKEWGPTQQAPVQASVTVRGHDAIRYDNENDPALVWQERPGVLVWVAVPSTFVDRLSTVAQNVRRTDGPSTIPHRVMVAPLAKRWDAMDNDGDGVIAAISNGVECVGLDYVDTCGEAISTRTVVRPTPSGQTRVAGSAPANVTSVRVEVEGSLPVLIDTVSFANYKSRFYSTVIAARVVRSVTWLDANAQVVATTSFTAPHVDASAAAVDSGEGSRT